jgi:hypothetical protein
LKVKYGYEVPRNYADAIDIDRRNKNTKWQDAVALELKQIDDYCTFIDLGPKETAKIPKGYKKICVHLVYNVKHDGCHKGR